MADTFGAISIPVAAPAAGYPAGDTALKYLGDFIKAALTANCQTMWTAVTDSAASEPICRAAYTHDPKDGVVSYSGCPCVYVWRSRIGTEQMADDWATQESVIRVLWLMHPSDQSTRVTHTPAFNAIAKVIRSRLYEGRTPTWTVAGDTDTKAATLGSSLLRWCGFNKIVVSPAEPAEIVVEGADGSRHGFDGLVLELRVTESLTRDPSVTGTTPYLLNGTVGIAENGAIPGDCFETTYAAGCHPSELYAEDPEAIEADSPELVCEPDALVTTLPGRIDSSTYTATGTGATRPTLELTGWNSTARSMLFAANDLLSLNALADVVEGDDTEFSLVMVLQFSAHDAGALLWNFTDSAGSSYFRAYSAGAGATINTARCDAVGTAKIATGTTAVNTDRAIVVWSFDGSTLTTHVNGSKELDGVDLDVGSLTLDTFTIGGASTVGRRVAAAWFCIGEALSDADAIAATAKLAERWPYS